MENWYAQSTVQKFIRKNQEKIVWLENKHIK